MPRITDRLLRKRLHEYRAMARHDAKATKFTIAWHVFEFFALAAGVAALWFSVVSIQHAIVQTDLAREALVEQKIANAWDLFENSQNDQVRVYAINTLIGKGFDLYGIDFSCSNPPEDQTSDNVRCTRPLNGIQLKREASSPPDPTSMLQEVASIMDANFKNRWIFDLASEGISLTGVDFSGNQIVDAQFKNTLFTVVSFDDAFIVDTVFKHDPGFSHPSIGGVVISVTTFKNSRLDNVTFENVRFGIVDFSKTELQYTRLVNVDVEQSGELLINISGAKLCEGRYASTQNVKCLMGLTQEIVDTMWYYEGQPPTGLDEERFSHLKFNEPCKDKDGNQTLHISNDFTQSTDTLFLRAKGVSHDYCAGL